MEGFFISKYCAEHGGDVNKFSTALERTLHIFVNFPF